MRRLIYTFCLLGMTSHLYSASAITVLFTSNKVVAKHGGGGERTLSRGSSLSPGDTVVTGAKAAANIKYSNGTLINLGENSNYTIVDYSPKSDVQLKTKLDSGKLRLKTTGKTKEEVATPIVALAILGTDANIFVPSSQSTYVNVTEGSVQGKGGSVNTGDSALFNKDGSTLTPFPKEGGVAPPAGAQGTISGTAAPSGATNSGGGPVNDLENIALTTTTGVGTSTSNTASAASQGAIDLIITCQ